MVLVAGAATATFRSTFASHSDNHAIYNIDTIPDTNRYFYEVGQVTRSGNAAGFGVPMKQIVELNELEDASDIRVGEIIEIPQGLVIVTLLSRLDDCERWLAPASRGAPIYAP